MNQLDKLIPKRRFKEFQNAEAWEQRELSELTYVYDGTHQTPRYTDKGVMFLSVENIKLMKSNKYISVEDFKDDFKVFPEKGDVLMTRIGDIGTANIYDSNEPVAYYVSLALLKTKELDPYYLKEVIGCDAVQKELWHRTLHIAFPKKINKNEIEKVIVPYPKEELEQEKIGKLFIEINNLISLHQRKLDKMKKLKKAYLCEMFPAEGVRKPKRRFKGFADDWEQRKLEELSDFITKGATPTTYGFKWEEDGIPFFRNDSIKDNRFVFGEYSYISEEANNTLIRSEICSRDILVAITGDIGKVGIVPESIVKANINQHMAKIRIKKDAYPYFVYQYLSTDEMQKKYKKIKTGISMPQLSLEQIRNVKILLPSMEEQKKIGCYFQNIDNLITLHQRKLDKLQNIKKAYLNEMFV